MEPFDPPFQQFYKNLFDNHFIDQSSPKTNQIEAFHEVEASESELPLIDLSRLNHGGFDCEQCKREIAEASQQWGFFQVVNHGISWEILEKMRHEQVKAFKKPFHDKVNGNGHRELNFPADSYRWGTPSATCLQQLAWSEAFHVPLTEISTVADAATGLRYIHYNKIGFIGHSQILSVLIDLFIKPQGWCMIGLSLTPKVKSTGRSQVQIQGEIKIPLWPPRRFKCGDSGFICKTDDCPGISRLA